MWRKGLFSFLGVLLITGSAWALEPADKCEADKVKEAGKLHWCRMKAESKAIKKGTAPDFSKCDSKYAAKWPSIESKAGGACPTNGDEGAVSGKVTEQTDLLTALLQDPNQRFVDNGDGTVTDNQTGLMWEKKVAGSDCLHCVDDEYPWSPGFEVFGPSAELPSMFDWLSEVNGVTGDPNSQTGFAGYSDWRIPTIVELQTIVDLSAPGCGAPTYDPCIDPIFGPTLSYLSFYWSFTTSTESPANAWIVHFENGGVGYDAKIVPFSVRAVRGP